MHHGRPRDKGDCKIGNVSALNHMADPRIKGILAGLVVLLDACTNVLCVAACQIARRREQTMLLDEGDVVAPMSDISPNVRALAMSPSYVVDDIPTSTILVSVISCVWSAKISSTDGD
jgi:type II secretory pathway component PulM